MTGIQLVGYLNCRRNVQQLMSIIYSVVVRQDDNGQQVTLCNYDSAHGNYPTITEQILKKIKLQDAISYKYNEEYIYHIKRDTNLIYVCLGDTTLKIKTAFIFLDEIIKKFKEKYSPEEINSAFAFGMNSSFAEIYKQQFILYNNNKEPDKKETLNKELERLQLQMNQNIEKVLQREEKVEMTVKKATKLQTISQQIKDRSNRVNNQAFWAKHKCKFLILGSLLAAGGGVFLIL